MRSLDNTSLDGTVERLMTGEGENEKQRLRRQRLRSIAIALALGFMVALFYAATIVRLGGNVMNRPL